MFTPMVGVRLVRAWLVVPCVVLPEAAENVNLLGVSDKHMISESFARWHMDGCVFDTLKVFVGWFFNVRIANPEVTNATFKK